MTDTQPQRLPNRVIRWEARILAALAIVALLVVIVAGLVPARFVASKEVVDADGAESDVATPYALVPASAEPVNRRVSFGDLGDDVAVDTNPDGSVYFVTIQEPRQSVLSHWIGEPEPEIRPLTYDEKYPPGQSPGRQRIEQLRMMATASQTAQYVAFTRGGYDASKVNEVLVGDPYCEVIDASGQYCATWGELRPELQLEDVIESVDGTPIETLDDLSAAMAGREPGTSVDLGIRRDGADPQTVTIELLPAPNDPDRGMIGISPVESVAVSLPFELSIDTGTIGGPSAGLAFTLTLLDELTPGNLLGGHDVAVTGTIDLDGNVGPIGGLEQKASAVRQAGLSYFLVPAGQDPDEVARAQAIAGDDVELITVATVDEALDALAGIGGDEVVIATT